MIKDLIQNNASVLITLTDAQLEAYSVNLINKVMENLHSTKKDDLLSPEEVASKMKIAKVTLWRWEKQGYLIPSRLGRKVYYKESDIKRIMEG